MVEIAWGLLYDGGMGWYSGSRCVRRGYDDSGEDRQASECLLGFGHDSSWEKTQTSAAG